MSFREAPAPCSGGGLPGVDDIPARPGSLCARGARSPWFALRSGCALPPVPFRAMSRTTRCHTKTRIAWNTALREKTFGRPLRAENARLCANLNEEMHQEKHHGEQEIVVVEQGR